MLRSLCICGYCCLCICYLSSFGFCIMVSLRIHLLCLPVCCCCPITAWLLLIQYYVVLCLADRSLLIDSIRYYLLISKYCLINSALVSCLAGRYRENTASNPLGCKKLRHHAPRHTVLSNSALSPHVSIARNVLILGLIWVSWARLIASPLAIANLPRLVRVLFLVFGRRAKRGARERFRQ